VIVEAASTGQPGDGMVFVLPIEEARFASARSNAVRRRWDMGKRQIQT
jgi:nitrogen regulatory protein PII